MADQLGLDLDGAAPKRARAGALRAFHVRSSMPVPEALEGEARAESQDAAVLSWFLDRPGLRATPSDVAVAFPAWPLTSVRRALTNLTKRGSLVHWPGDRRLGPRGGAESTWGLAL